MMKRISILILAMLPTLLWAQFAPGAGNVGTTAMHADSSAFVAWATGCTIERGPIRIDNPSLGMASYGNDAAGIGKADNTLVSLGDGGAAVLTFASPIYNGEGPDFAVFENGFAWAQDTSLYFLELAFVEVSSDGENYFRFPAVCNFPDSIQVGSFECTDPTLIHNLASKYEVMYGTPFDLDEVEDDILLDKNNVTHVRLVDAIGTINPEYATYDANGHVVNDPWPTEFASCGFDLDAVGVINDKAHFDVTEGESILASVYPNPVNDRLFVNAEKLQTVEVYNAMGQLVVTTAEPEINMSALSDGVYLIRVVCEGGMMTKRIVKQ